jgi:hypothetical protein
VCLPSMIRCVRGLLRRHAQPQIPLSCVVPLEVSTKCSRHEDRTLAPFPALLALVVFGCARVVRMLSLAFTSVTTVEGECHGENRTVLGPYWPTVKHQI